MFFETISCCFVFITINFEKILNLWCFQCLIFWQSVLHDFVAQNATNLKHVALTIIDHIFFIFFVFFGLINTFRGCRVQIRLLGCFLLYFLLFASWFVSLIACLFCHMFVLIFSSYHCPLHAFSGLNLLSFFPFLGRLAGNKMGRLSDKKSNGCVTASFGRRPWSTHWDWKTQVFFLGYGCNVAERANVLWWDAFKR